MLVNQNEVYKTVIYPGFACSINNLVEHSIKRYGLDWMRHVIPNPSVRPDYQILVFDLATIMVLGWRPTIKLNELNNIMLERS